MVEVRGILKLCPSLILYSHAIQPLISFKRIKNIFTYLSITFTHTHTNIYYDERKRKKEATIIINKILN